MCFLETGKGWCQEKNNDISSKPQTSNLWEDLKDAGEDSAQHRESTIYFCSVPSDMQPPRPADRTAVKPAVRRLQQVLNSSKGLMINLDCPPPLLQRD